MAFFFFHYFPIIFIETVKCVYTVPIYFLFASFHIYEGNVRDMTRYIRKRKLLAPYDWVRCVCVWGCAIRQHEKKKKLWWMSWVQNEKKKTYANITIYFYVLYFVYMTTHAVVWPLKKDIHNTHIRIQNVNKYKIVHLFMCAAGKTVAHNNLACSEFYIHIYIQSRPWASSAPERSSRSPVHMYSTNRI